MSWVKIVAINCLVFLLLVLCAEMAARIAWFPHRLQLLTIATRLLKTWPALLRMPGAVGFVGLASGTYDIAICARPRAPRQ